MYRIGGRLRNQGVSFDGVILGIPPLNVWNSNEACYPRFGQCQVGSLTGAVASQKVTEALKGSLSTVGNRTKSVKAKGSLIARHTGRAR